MRFVVSVAVLLAGFVGLCAIEPPKPKFTMSRETTVILEPLDKDGYPDYETALNQKLRGTIKPEQNANALLWQAMGPSPEGNKPLHADYWKWLQADCPPEKGEYFVDLMKFLKSKGPQEYDEAFNTRDGNTNSHPWKAGDHPDFAEWLKSNEIPLAKAIEASRRSHYYNPLVSRESKSGEPGMLIGALLPNVQKVRAIGAALAKRAMLRTGEQKYADAWADLLALQRLARHVGHGGTMIELLVGIALEAIASNATIAFLHHSKPTAPQVLGYMKDLDQLPPRGSAAEKFDLGERYTMLNAITFLRKGGLNVLEGLAGGGVPPGKEEEAKKSLELLDWDSLLKLATSMYDRAYKVMANPDRIKRKEDWKKIEQEIAKRREELRENAQDLQEALRKGELSKHVSEQIGFILVSLLLPALEKVHTAADRAEQTNRNLKLALALAAYRADTGRYPKQLAELTPKYLAAIPEDLFAGKAMNYRTEGEGYLLYSVGENGKDDDGQWYDDEPRGDDPRVRMPPKPPKK